MTASTAPQALARKLDALPDGPGVYIWKDAAGAVLYVGKAANLRSRVRSYFTSDHSASPKNQLLVRLIADVETIVVEHEAQSLLLENNLIKEYQPRFNVRLKDDKSYPSIAVTLKEPFPRVLVTRRRDLPGARYFGPYTDVGEMRRALALVRRIFTVRSCADDIPRERRDRPCLDYHIVRCRAPCVGRQDEASYRAMIGEVVAFLEGRTADVRTELRTMMQAASEREDYERARDLRDTLRWLEQVETPPTVETIGTAEADRHGHARGGDRARPSARPLPESPRLESFEADQRALDPVYSLGRDLGLAAVPRFLVCIDISTSQGKDTVGSLVTFEGGRPRKSEYRKFRIKGAGQQDDYAAIHEVVTRYLARRREEGKPLPDLVVIDGGKGQLHAAIAAAQALGLGHLPFISLAKKEEEISLPDRPDALRLSRRSPSLQLLQRARDEAHRFGVAYNRTRRAARTITSALLDTPGVGPTRRPRLLERFGSLAGVKSASESLQQAGA